MIATNNRRPSLAERIAARVVVDPETGCHVWTGCLCRDGYGKIRVSGEQQLAHRAAWEQANGPIPPGIFVCHKCDRPACVNPSHLFLGTHADNMADMIAKDRQAKLAGEANGSARLTDADIVAIRAAVAGGESRRSIARRFGVCPSLVSQIASGRRWRHAGGPITPAQKPRSGGNRSRGAAHGNARLTDDAVVEIRRAHAAGVSIRSMARLHEVHRATISGVVHRRTWRHVPDPVVVVTITPDASPTITTRAAS